MVGLDLVGLWRVMLQVSDVLKARTPRDPRVILMVALAVWTTAVLTSFALLADSNARPILAGTIYWTAAIFALIIVARSIKESRGRERLFFGFLGAGLMFMFVGDLGWTSLQTADAAERFVSLQQGFYLVAHLLLAGALLVLVQATVKGIATVTALDALAVMLSIGTLAWFFVVDSAVAGGSWGLAAVLSWALFDAALLFLGLVVLSASGGAVPAKLLVAGFLAFLVADTMYLDVRSGGIYEVGGYPEFIWALGILLIGGSSLWPGLMESSERQRINPWRVFAFWFGPLSPPLHFAVLLVWCAVRPPPPVYVMAGAAALLLYLAARVALVSFVTRRLSAEQEETTRRLEESRVLHEMHETVKQSIHGIALSANAALEADRLGEKDKAREMLGRALAASREAEHRVSRPYDELQTFHGEGAPSVSEHLRHRLEKFEEYFGVRTHADLQEPLDSLNAAEVAVVYRVAIEAFWNVAKHSRARNMYLESRRVGRTLIIRVRDDGRGFDAGKPPPGMGLTYMRQRAGEVGAKLDVISTPTRGACVQLRFDKG